MEANDEDDEDFDEDDMPEAVAEVPKKEADTAAVVLKAVEALNAYLPSPADDIDWFKRVLKGIRSVQRDPTAAKVHWYPWGCPPVVHKKSVLYLFIFLGTL
jgi:hypothetical protein